ncbi:MAG: hypothetical protein R6V31_08145 [Halohasta sp.]
MMRRLGTILMAVALVSALLAVPLGVAAVGADEPNATETVAPGERLAGVVGIQQAEVDGDLSERRYAARLDRADTDAERAAIVEERRAVIERRLADHEADLADLRAAREAGNISEGTYQGRIATLDAEAGSTERAAAQTSETARQLPAEVREARGISVDDLDRLRANASELGGSETADIAREIGGPEATPAGGPRDGGPTAAAPDRNASDRPDTADDRQPTGSQADAADDTNRSTESNGADSASSADASPNDQGDSDESTEQQDTDDRNEPADQTDERENAPTDSGQRSNGQ